MGEACGGSGDGEVVGAAGRGDVVEWGCGGGRDDAAGGAAGEGEQQDSEFERAAMFAAEEQCQWRDQCEIDVYWSAVELRDSGSGSDGDDERCGVTE